MGASGSVEPPDADELKRLFDKHDVTGSGNLERQEAQENLELASWEGDVCWNMHSVIVIICNVELCR